MRRYNNIWIACLSVLFIFFSCVEEDWTEKGVIGKTATIQLLFETPEVDRIQTKTLNDRTLLVEDLRLFIFNSAGNLIYDNTYDIGSTDKSGTLTDEITVSTGTNYIYALANTGGAPFASIGALTNIETKSQLLQAVATWKGDLLLSGNIIPMTGTVKEANADGSVVVNSNATYTIQLKRLVASVKFNVSCGMSGAKFNLTSYEVFNAPQTSTLWGDNANGDKTKWNAGTITNEDTMQSFEFYMFENKQNASSVTTYDEREEKIESTAVGDDVKFKNAPSGSTYVVLRGKYEGPAEVGGISTKVTGDVIYYIHLGNTNTLQSGNMSNFETLRNTEYTYSVKIMGVKKLIYEVEHNDPYDRGDGTISLSANTFNLDAHYEYFNVTIPKSSEYKTDATDGVFGWYSFRIHEEKNATYVALSPGEERNWIKVMPYKKSGNNEYNSALITNIDKLNEALAKCETDQVTLTCFVDENLTDQARQSLVFKESKTGHGSTIQNEGIRLNQTYMRKFFNNDGKGYGWEVLNETGTRTKGDITDYMVATYTANSSSNGWQNTKTIVGSNWPNNQSELEKFQKACMSRNRDEDGDGEIDDNELKWYLPALDQYIGAWMGADALGEARLYTNNALEGLHYVSSTKRKISEDFMVLWAEEGSAYGDVNGSISYGLDSTKYQLRCVRNYNGGDNTPNVTPASYYKYDDNKFTMYLLPASYRNFQDKGELSTDGGHLGTDNKLYEGFELGDVKKDVSSFDDQKNKADKDKSVCSEEVGGIKDGYIYEKYYTGYWFNTSYAYFKKVDSGGKYGYNYAGDILSDNAKTKNYVMVSKEEAVQTNGWRLPNQREFTLMSIVKALENADSGTQEYISRTISAFSYGGKASYRGFMYDSSNIHLSGKDEQDELESIKKVRCVRDKK